MIAWGSQVVLVFGSRYSDPGALFWAVAAVVQFVLIAVGLIFGIRVVALGRAAVPKSAGRSAIAGIVLSGGTILLVAVMIVMSIL